jgi:PEP-CTERM motif
MRIAALTVLCLALAAVPAWANYDNGPINGTTDAWTINFGYIVSDTFTLSSAATVNSVSFGVWEFPGDTMQTVDWTITATENGAGVGLTSNVTDKYISTNQYGYNIDLISFNTGGVPLNAGTYWLNLYNATVPSGDPVYWDENSGVGCGGSGCPSQASESAVGTIPSEAFTIGTSGSTSGSTPEPSSIMLFGSGILGLAGVLRRKLF